VGQNLQRILTLWGESFQMSVYLADNVSTSTIQQIKNTLQQKDEIGDVQFVSQEQALGQFREQLASYAPDLLTDPDLVKMIPSSFQVSLNSKVPAEDQLNVMQKVAGDLTNQSGVDEVSYGQDWVKNYGQVIRAAQGLGWIFSLIIMGSAIFVISNCIRSSIYQRKEAIEVLELIGATKTYIRRPFLVEGIGLCLGGAAAGIFVTYGIYLLALETLRSQLAFLQISHHVHFITGFGILGLLSLSAALGWLAATVCLKTVNDGWAASRRVNHES